MNNEIAYNELNIIINQQSILNQKVSVLFVINNGIFLTLISLFISMSFPWWSLVVILFLTIPPIIMNILILYPNFSGAKKSKYFYDFSKMEVEDIQKYIIKENEVFEQIKINSNILIKKYKIFRLAITWTFIGIPGLIFWINKLIKK